MASSFTFAPNEKPFSGSGPEGDSYFRESRQPIYSAALVLPFLLIYEIGVVLFRSDVINGGEAIVMKLGFPLVKYMGVSGSFVSVIFLAAAFVIWQIWRRGKWRIQIPVLTTMFFESLFFAILLFLILGVFAHYVSTEPESLKPKRHASLELEKVRQTFLSAQGQASKRNGPVECATRTGAAGIELRDFILYCGAGVFEELVFRVLLLGLLMLVFTRLLHMEHAYAAAWSVAIGAFLFSSFHHFGENGDRFEVNVFLQRLIAGLYFSALYYTRSFGIAAASHAMYDILVGLNRI